jgi:hypothetical protein
MDAGTVIKWKNFKDRQYEGDVKPRWFVYMGNTGILSIPYPRAYLLTTTGRVEKFKIGGDREKHTHCTFDSNTSPFESPCVMDFEEDYYPYELSKIESNPDIEIKERLRIQDIQMIWNKILRSSIFTKMEQRDIYDGLKRENIPISGKRP